MGFEGGCACGAAHYRSNAEPLDCGCHCRTGQRAFGARVLASAPKPSLQLTRGEPQKRRSSEIGDPRRCRDCDASLAMHVVDRAGLIDISAITSDRPAVVPPIAHWFPRCARSRHEADDAGDGVGFSPGG